MDLVKVSKGVFVAIVLASLGLGGRVLWNQTHSLLKGPMKMETFAAKIPQQLDVQGGNWRTLSFGYHLAPWLVSFRGEPVVTTLNYEKGPPTKFVSEWIQVWSPGSVELSIEGPRTPSAGMTALDWKNCLGSAFCITAKNRLIDSVLRDLVKEKGQLKELTWFESDALQAARGIHLHFEIGGRRWDRYVVFTNNGIAQNFTLKTNHDEAGDEARLMMDSILQGMTVSDTLDSSREWIASRIKTIDLNQVRSISDSKTRYIRLFEVQNLLCSQLAIDPRFVAPYFHLAGVTHLLGVSLLKEKKVYFKNQESWSLLIQPLLSSLVQYVGDFPEGTEKQKGERAAALANMEALQQDFLLLREKLSK
jgi:hypothetical protein